jgi:hypothetical protein
MAKKKNQTLDSISYSEAELYLRLDKNIKDLSKDRDARKAEYKEFVLTAGKKQEDDSLVVVVSDKNKQPIQFKVAKRYSAELSGSAIDIIIQECTRLQRRQLIETVEIVRFDRLQEMIKSGDISPELGEKLITLKEQNVFTADFQK